MRKTGAGHAAPVICVRSAHAAAGAPLEILRPGAVVGWGSQQAPYPWLLVFGAQAGLRPCQLVKVLGSVGAAGFTPATLMTVGRGRARRARLPATAVPSPEVLAFPTLAAYAWKLSLHLQLKLSLNLRFLLSGRAPVLAAVKGSSRLRPNTSRSCGCCAVDNTWWAT